MNSNNKIKLLWGILLVCIIISGCGPSPEEQQATASAQTAAAATDTPTPTTTPTPTFTPTPTKTPTPTPTPVPDAGTMIDREKLALPSIYKVDSPDDWGIQKGAFAYRATNKTYYIENSFVFADNESGELVFGYTVDLSGKSDIEEVDELLSEHWAEAKDGYASTGRTILGGAPILGADGIGEKSGGFRVEYMAGNTHIILDQIGFRIGDIYAVTIVKNFQGTDPFISVVDVAKVYASSIQNPIFPCYARSITPVESAEWPTFNYHVDGFYPSESLIVLIEGEVQLDGEPTLIGYADGLGDESAVNRVVGDKILDRSQSFEMFGYNMYSIKADRGQTEGVITLIAVEGFAVTLPEKFTLSIFGLYSGCEISAEIAWP